MSLYGGYELQKAHQSGIQNSSYEEELKEIEKVAIASFLKDKNPYLQVSEKDLSLQVNNYDLRRDGDKVAGWSHSIEVCYFSLKSKVRNEAWHICSFQGATANCGLLALQGLAWFVGDELLEKLEKLFFEQMGYSCLIYSTGGGQQELDKLLKRNGWKKEVGFHNKRSDNFCQLYSKIYES